MSPQISVRSLHLPRHLPRRETLRRANTLLLETLVVGGLIVSAIAAMLYDIGRLLSLV